MMTYPPIRLNLATTKSHGLPHGLAIRWEMSIISKFFEILKCTICDYSCNRNYSLKNHNIRCIGEQRVAKWHKHIYILFTYDIHIVWNKDLCIQQKDPPPGKQWTWPGKKLFIKIFCKYSYQTVSILKICDFFVPCANGLGQLVDWRPKTQGSRSDSVCTNLPYFSPGEKWRKHFNNQFWQNICITKYNSN